VRLGAAMPDLSTFLQTVQLFLLNSWFSKSAHELIVASSLSLSPGLIKPSAIAPSWPFLCSAELPRRLAKQCHATRSYVQTLMGPGRVDACHQ
jgi:hypothetical protein